MFNKFSSLQWYVYHFSSGGRKEEEGDPPQISTPHQRTTSEDQYTYIESRGPLSRGRGPQGVATMQNRGGQEGRRGGASSGEEHGVPGRGSSIRVESGVPQAMSGGTEDPNRPVSGQSPMGLQTRPEKHAQLFFPRTSTGQGHAY